MNGEAVRAGQVERGKDPGLSAADQARYIPTGMPPSWGATCGLGLLGIMLEMARSEENLRVDCS